MPARYNDTSKKMTAHSLIHIDHANLKNKKYSLLEHILNLVKCTEIYRTLHTSSLNAMKLIESCALGITGPIPVYYVDD